MQKIAKIKPIYMQIAYLKKRLHKIVQYKDSFTASYYYDKLVRMNKELRTRIREWEKCEKEKKLK